MPNSIFPEAQEGGSCSWEAPPRGEHHHHHHHHQEKDSFLKGPAAWPSSSSSYYASPPSSSSSSLSLPSSASSSRTSSASSSLATSPRNHHHHLNYVPGFVNVSKRREEKMTAVAPAPLPVHHSNPFYSPEYLRQYASHHHNQQHQHQQHQQHQHQHPRRGACPDMKWTTPRGGFHTNSWCQAPRAKKPEKRSSQDRKFKTKMCRYLERNGYCPHGQECCFAHHPDELRPEPEDKRRKTRPCMFFFQDGYCPFGKHCHFLHTLEEKKLSEKGRELAAFMRFKKSTRLPIFEVLAPSQQQQQQ